jgi:hypothetical protein
MADIANALKTYLKTITAVTDEIGTGDNARIYLDEARQGAALPYVVITTFAAGSKEDLQGAVGVAQNRVQVDCYADSSAKAFMVADAIRLAPLQGRRGTIGGVYAYDVSSDGGYDRGSDHPSTGSEQTRYICSRDYVITFVEAT